MLTEFKTASHLASYAGTAPTTRRSGTSIRGEFADRGGNKRLKSSLDNSAFAALHHPPSSAYYDRKIEMGKRHKRVIIALARRRLDTLYAHAARRDPLPRPSRAAASEHSLAVRRKPQRQPRPVLPITLIRTSVPAKS
ncbi:transposase [Nesterenkonia sp. YGD6]|uniref:transposase n=1 Tax=Nesterenkonia sp. YGD6 TaxID=2901231 RepID=UPI00406C68E5